MGAFRRPNRDGKTLLVVLLTVFAILAVVVIWVWQKPATQPNLEEGRAVADAFLADVHAGRAAAAWESTTAEFKSAMGRETFQRYVKDHPALVKPLSFVSVQTVTVANSPRTEYVYRCAETGGMVRLLAGNERGTWRIDRVATD